MIYLTLNNNNQMEVIKQYMELYPTDDVVVMGGGAAWLWLNEQIELHDIDVHVNTGVAPIQIFNRFKDLLPGYFMTSDDIPGLPCEGFSCDKQGCMSYDIFINQDVNEGVPLNGLYVVALEDLIEEHEIFINEVEGTTDEYELGKLRCYT